MAAAEVVDVSLVEGFEWLWMMNQIKVDFRTIARSHSHDLNLKSKATWGTSASGVGDKCKWVGLQCCFV